jgi:hypothetical protein
MNLLMSIALVMAIFFTYALYSGPESTIAGFFRPSNATYSKVKTSPGFVKVAPKIYRFTYAWPQIPYLVDLPLATFLVDGGDQDWALVDAGVPGAKYKASLLPNITSFLSEHDGTLQLLIRTEIDMLADAMVIWSGFPV